MGEKSKMTIAILAIDALEYTLVEEFDKPNLKQVSYGKTDISEFSEPRTMVLWSSFATGENKEKEVLARGDEEMWNISWNIKETFFSKFKSPCIIDLPGFNHDKKTYELSRNRLREYFDAEDAEEKNEIRGQYNKEAFDHHKKTRKEFMKALCQDHDLVLGYFSVADVVGHLSFGDGAMMHAIYDDLDGIAAEVRGRTDDILVISDHGMKALGRFGDHSEYGFWSLNSETELKNPRITDFGRIINELKIRKCVI